MTARWPAALSCAWLLALSGCRGAPAGTLPRAQPAERTLEATVAGVPLVIAVRPTPGAATVTLRIDAGSRDAKAPQLATLAAWVAAERAGRAFRAEVTPDATTHEALCARQELAACIAGLGRILSARTASPSLLDQLRARLVYGRRQALAADPLRRAEALALQALLGAPGAGFFPLGVPAGDSLATDAAVLEFLRAHYGASRARVIVTGDVEPGEVQALVAGALARLPDALAARAELPLSPRAVPAIELTVEERDAIVVALAAASAAHARDAVTTFARSLERYAGTPAQALHVMDVRGGGLALVRITPTDGSVSGVAAVTTLLARLAAETNAGARLAYGLGVLARGDAQATPRSPDAGAAPGERLRARARELLARAAMYAGAQVRGTVAAHAASVVTALGARIDAVGQSGARVAIAVHSAHGAAQDPALSHGRSALLATLTTTACAGLGPEGLQHELRALGATLVPEVSASAYGVLLEVDAAHARQGIDLALACMLRPSLSESDLATAATRLQGRLQAAGDDVLAAHAAHLLAPRAPGLVAPWGSRDRLGNLTRGELSALAARALTAASLAVAVVGPVDVTDTVQRVARRLAPLPAGALPPPATPGTSSARGEPASGLRAALAVLVSYGAAGDSPAGAAVAAAGLRAALARTTGLEAFWHHGDAQGGLAHASVALRPHGDTMSELAPALAAAASALAKEHVGDLLQAELAARHLREAAAEGLVARRASRIARSRAAGVAAPDSLAAAEATLRALLQARAVVAAAD